MIADKLISFQTHSGQQLSARPLAYDDAPYFVDIFNHMSAESRYLRFQQTLDKPNPNYIQRQAQDIAQMAPGQQGGLIAFRLDGVRPTAVAVARYVRIDAHTAEIAMSVRDDMQNQGVGSWLLALAVEQARCEGIHTLTGSALNHHDAIWHILGKLPYPYTRQPDGTVSEIEIDLTKSIKPV